MCSGYSSNHPGGDGHVSWTQDSGLRADAASALTCLDSTNSGRSKNLAGRGPVQLQVFLLHRS